MSDQEIPNPHKEAQMHLLGANLLYLTLAQIASPSVHVHTYDIDSDTEDK
jgi:hypothetical protein